ncbi:hypothetical protein [uncultured Methylobacterium sp.]|uniref:hypothetical protein n=1 Tax=uncultured Methylobacterium sp. TaxID=157278 RepID=UPI0035CC53BB
MRAVILVSAMCFALGGCITQAVQEKDLAEAGPKDDAYCRSIGAQPGTPTYAQCRLTMRQEMLTKQAETRARLAAIGDALGDAGDSFAAGQRAAASRNVNCTSTRFGNQVQTNCY